MNVLVYATMSQGPRSMPALVGTTPAETAVVDLAHAMESFLASPMACMHIVVMKEGGTEDTEVH